MANVEAVTITNRDGLKLYGTLHGSPSSGNLPAVVLLSPGVKMRVGPGRLYVPLTAALTSLGYTVLRFDFFGLGDSEGELGETALADVYNHIEVGRYVDDTLCALNWLHSEHGLSRFILGGLCGGAITALLASERDSRVEGLLSLGMTVTLASNAATPAAYITRAQLDHRRKLYYRRLLEPKSWLRFLTFQSEYAVLWRALKRLVVKERENPSPVAATATPDVPVEQRGNANPLFPRAFLAFLQRGGMALMLFSEKDRLQSEYEEKFAAPYAGQLQPYEAQITKHVVPHANHVLTFREWQQEMVDICEGWIKQIQGVRHGA